MILFFRFLKVKIGFLKCILLLSARKSVLHFLVERKCILGGFFFALLFLLMPYVVAHTIAQSVMEFKLFPYQMGLWSMSCFLCNMCPLCWRSTAFICWPLLLQPQIKDHVPHIQIWWRNAQTTFLVQRFPSKRRAHSIGNRYNYPDCCSTHV